MLEWRDFADEKTRREKESPAVKAGFPSEKTSRCLLQAIPLKN